MKRLTMIAAIKDGFDRAVASHTSGATLKPWGASQTIDIPGYRYTTTTPRWGENTETLLGTISGWVRGLDTAEDVVAAVAGELHGDKWRTYESIYWRLQFTGVRMESGGEPGVYRFDMDFEAETARDVAYRY